LAKINQPTLIVSAQDSPEAFRRVDGVLAETLPNSGTVLVEGATSSIQPTRLCWSLLIGSWRASLHTRC
jgi:hypothetical protein